MPDKRHETEAEKILVKLGMRNHVGPDETRLLLARALEQAEQRGREMAASQKESSG